jgi:hypothetical protein
MKFRYAAVGLAAASLLTLGVASSASAHVAGGYPTPTPTPTQFTAPPPVPGCDMKPVTVEPVLNPYNYNPNPRHCPRIRQQEFDLQVGTFNQDGTVLGTGPIRFDTGTDQTLSPTLDRFSQGGNSVLIHHEALGGVTVDRATCTLLLDQQDLPWWINGGGTGVDRGALAVGLYDLRGIFSFPTRNFQCTLPFGLTPARAAWDLNHNVGLPDPLMFDVSVQAAGASELRVVEPRPVPCPTETQPYESPSPAFGYQGGCPTPTVYGSPAG